MPEIIEIEYYRRAAAVAVGQTVLGIDLPDPDYLVGASLSELDAAIARSTLVGTRRLGKLLLLDFDSGVSVGMRFGMTGRLIVDGSAPIEKLEYSSGRNDVAWDRFRLHLTGGDGDGAMIMRDQRRLGNVSLDPDLERLGVDAWQIDADGLAAALGESTTALKARLLDQSKIAGLGNLLTDETLWRAGLSPVRPAGGLDGGELAVLASTIRSTIAELDERGGSHMGDLQSERHTGGRCPVDDAALARTRAGGRTTWWCPAHQR